MRLDAEHHGGQEEPIGTIRAAEGSATARPNAMKVQGDAHASTNCNVRLKASPRQLQRYGDLVSAASCSGVRKPVSATPVFFWYSLMALRVKIPITASMGP
jgi:hypothetical protein